MRFKFLTLFIFISSVSLQAQVQFNGLKSVNGTELYFKVIGKGSPLIVIHGGPGLNQSYFFPYLDALAKNHTLIFYDQRSSGKSALSVQQNMNFHQFALDIDSIRKIFGYEKINLMGHSWGGLLAAYYATNYPDQVQSLIFCNTVPLSNKFENEMIAAFQKKTTAADSLKRTEIMATEEFIEGRTQALEQLMMLTFKTIFCDSSKLKLLQLRLPENYMVASMSYYGFAKDLKQYDFYNDLSSLKIPVLIIHGTCDNIPLKVDEKIQASVKDSKLVVFKESGHFPFIEEPKLFTKTVRKFLKTKGN